MGAIIYDLNMNPFENWSTIQSKWVSYLVMARDINTADTAKCAVQIPGANNIVPTKLKKISLKVETYVNNDRLMTDIELKEITHIPLTNNSDTDSTASVADDEEYEYPSGEE